ncbi:MAG: hypothetical protein U0359_28795 [Byssovorax sp.]
MSEASSRLAVLIDGAPLPEEEARALWVAFSEHMDQHRGDFAGFAALKGWFSVKPEHRQGKAVLVVQTSETAKVAPPPGPAPPRAGARAAGKAGKPHGKPRGKGPPPGGKPPKRGPGSGR